MVLSKDGDGNRGSKYWHDRADEARTIADDMLDGLARETMRNVALKYDLMARIAGEREVRIRERRA